MAITTKTTSGLAVTLTGILEGSDPVVRVELTHPKLGKVSFTSRQYGRVQGNDGIIGFARNQRMCVTVSRADFNTALAEADALKEKEIEELKSGTRKIRLSWQQGSPLSGWSVSGRAVALLLELGLASSVEGWGYHVSQKVVDALGEEFTYAEALEFTRPAREQKQARQASKEQARQEKFTQARTTNQEVELASWSEPCDGSQDECDIDLVTEYARPDGTTRRSRVHTH